MLSYNKVHSLIHLDDSTITYPDNTSTTESTITANIINTGLDLRVDFSLPRVPANNESCFPLKYPY